MREPAASLARAPRRRRLTVVATFGAVVVLALAACGGGATGAAEVASIDAAADDGTSSATTVAADTEEAWLEFAQCMRDEGVDMQDPTFDADGNVQGGFGPESGIDPRDEDTQAAMTACGDLIEGLDLGGPGGRSGFDPDEIEIALADYTACLRDEGLEVDDVSFGVGAGGGPVGDAAGGQPANGATPPDGFEPPAGGSVPEGGTPPGADGAGQDGQGGPPQGGEGFDPSDRIIEQLGLDADDPTVSAALDACQSLLDAAFQPADDSGDGSGAATTEEGGA